jgi:mRNA-degrading endonuclease HigB of HigAB toxin-antitoxin module
VERVRRGGITRAGNGEARRMLVEAAWSYRYRMVIAFHYRLQIAWIKFIGTHAEYDRIDALTVSQF